MLLQRLNLAIQVTATIVVVFAFLFGFGDVVLAQDLDAVGDAAGLSDAGLEVIIGRIIAVFLGLLGIILLVIIMYAGYLWMTAGGNTDQVVKAKKWIINGVVGLVITLSAYVIASFIMNLFYDAGLWGGGGDGPDSNPPVLEPGSNSLGSGGIQSHYPDRYATDIARNAKVMVTFGTKMAIGSFAKGYDDNGTPTDVSDDVVATALNTENILIYVTSEGEEYALGEGDVEVSFTEDLRTFVFDPSAYLGSATEDVGYTVYLSDDIENSDGDTGDVDDGGYWWTFTVGTEIDLTPPQIKSISPAEGLSYARNIVVEVTFDEAIDPTSATGTYAADGSGSFENIQIEADSSGLVEGTYVMSNAYKTVTFVSSEACGTNSCGQTIYCLPGGEDQTVTVFGATPGTDNPQIDVYPYDGIGDVSGNALDADGDDAVDSAGEQYAWAFTTTNDYNDDAPYITAVTPDVAEEDLALDADILVTFDSVMMSSTLSSENVEVDNSPDHELWFSIESEGLASDGSVVEDSSTTITNTQMEVNHGVFYESGDDFTYLYSVDVGDGVLNQYQNCFVPGEGPGVGSTECGTNNTYPYCCQGVPSAEECSFFE